MNNIKDNYIKKLEKALKTEPKIKEQIISDIRSDIEIRIANGESIENVIENLGSPKEVASEFNQSYPEYQSNKKKHIFSVFAIISTVVAVVSLVIGIIGRFAYMNSEQVSHIGGVDLPTEVIVTAEPISSLVIFDGLIKFSIVVFIIAILCVGYLILKYKKKGRK